MADRYLKAADVKKSLRQATRWKKRIDCRIYLGDDEYYLTPREDVARVLKETQVNIHRWTEERYDCDDFAFALKAAFCEDAYKNGQRRAAHSVGIIWGKLPEPHAMCWWMDPNRKVRLIEPQDDGVRGFKKSDKGIWLMMG